MVLLGVVLVVVGTRTGSRKRSKNRRDRSPSTDGTRQDSWPTPGRTTVTMRRKVEPWRPKGRAQASTQKSAEPPQNPESPLSPELPQSPGPAGSEREPGEHDRRGDDA